MEKCWLKEPLNNIESKWLEDFLALAEQRNFSRAAQSRNVTQPAFGRRIRTLEKTLGVELIDRSTTPIALTPEGRLFRTTARNLLRQFQDGFNQLQGPHGIGPQPLDFVTAHSLSLTLLPNLIRAISEDGSMLRSRVESIDVDLAVEALQEGRSDFLLAFDIEALMQPPFLCLSLGKTNLRPVCAPDENGSPKFAFDPDKPVPLLSYSPAAFMGRQVNSLLRNIKEPLTYIPVMESSLTSLLKVMAIQGEGIAWLPDYSISKELASGELVDFAGRQSQSEYWGEVEIVLYRNDVRLHAGAERFWSSLKKRCKDGWSLTIY